MNSRSSSKPTQSDPAAGRSGGDVLLARLGRARGTRGEIVLHLETDRPEEVLAGPGTFRLADGRSIAVEALVRYGDTWCWVIEGRPMREDLARYAQAKVVIDASELPKREDEDGWGEHEIIGMAVCDESGARLGRIVRIERRYEVDTWVMEDEQGREAEFPAVDEFVLEVDLASGIVTVNPAGIVRG